MADITLRLASPSDAAGVASCVCEAYVHYIERIGKQPGPMLEDYVRVISDAIVHVAVDEDRRAFLKGVLKCARDDCCVFVVMSGGVA